MHIELPITSDNFYCSAVKNSRKTVDTPLVVNFELDGKKIMALNGSPKFQLTEAISFVVDCENQEEIEDYCDRLTDGEQ